MKFIFPILLFLVFFINPAFGEEVTKMDRTVIAKDNIQKLLETAETKLASTDPDFAAIRDRLVFGEIINHNSLTPKQQILVIIVALTTNQLHENLADAVSTALRLEATPLEIKEAMYQCAPYIGFPRAESALKILNGILADKGIALPLESQATVNEETRLKDGLAAQMKIFGEERIGKMRDTAPAGQKELLANYLSAFCFGDFYTRKTLDLKMRELVTFSAIVSLGGCDSQATAHANANIVVGNAKQHLIDALVTMLPINGFPRTLNGLACVNKAVPEN